MDYGWISHALMWLIGVMAICASVGAVGALWALGRAGYTTKK